MEPLLQSGNDGGGRKRSADPATTIVGCLGGNDLDSFTASAKSVSRMRAYWSLPILRTDLEALEQVQSEFAACRKECIEYKSSFTANMLNSIFKLANELDAEDGWISSRILDFLTFELEAKFGACSSDAVESLLSDMIVLINEDFMGLTGEKWAMNLLAPTIHRDEVAQSPEAKEQFIHHIRAHLERMKAKHKDHEIIHWFLEGLRKSANRGTYGFLNFPSLYEVCRKSKGRLGWAVLGWLVMKLSERAAVEVLLFGTGGEEWKFNEIIVRTLPAFLKKLGSLHAAVEGQVKKGERIEAKSLALFASAAIVSGNMAARALWPICIHLLPGNIGAFLNDQ